MEMIVIYDNTGHIYYCAGGDVTEPQGLQFIRVTIPEGKILKSIDVTGNEPKPVFEEIEQSKTAKDIEDIKKQILDTQEAINYLLNSAE